MEQNRCKKGKLSVQYLGAANKNQEVKICPNHSFEIHYDSIFEQVAKY